VIDHSKPVLVLIPFLISVSRVSSINPVVEPSVQNTVNLFFLHPDCLIVVVTSGSEVVHFLGFVVYVYLNHKSQDILLKQ
jgi:hypothetical protein